VRALTEGVTSKGDRYLVSATQISLDSTATQDLAVPGDALPAAVSAAFRRIRLITWSLYGLLASVYLGVLFSPIQGIARLVALEIVYTAPIVVCVVLSVIAARRADVGERRFWVYLTVANATLVLCELMLVWWVLFISPSGPPRISWPFHALHVIAAFSFLLLVVAMSRVNQDGFASRIRSAIDIALLGIMAYVVLVLVYVRPVMERVDAPWYAVLLGGCYALTAFMLLFGTLANIVGFKLVKWRSWEMLTVASLAVYAVAVALWPMWYVGVSDTSRNLTRSLLDMVQLTGHFILMMAVVYRLTAPVKWHLRPLPTPAVIRSRWLPAVLPAAAVLAIPLLGLAAYNSHGDGPWFTVYGVLAAMLTGLVLARSLVLTFEHGMLFHRSVTDPLTGLYNHRFFHDRLNVEADASLRYGDPLCVIVLDIDDFGVFNEQYGHLEGDRLLLGLGEKLRAACPEPNIIARLGGDEFGIIVPEISVRAAAVICQRVLDVVGIECGVRPGGLSASAGLAAFPDHTPDPMDLHRLADGALFHAKETGKNHMVVYDAARVPDLSAHERMERLERQSRVGAVRALAAAVDARDPATRFHSQEVATLAVSLGRHLGLPAERLRMLELAALMHDVGKIALPDSILNKSGELTSEEWDEVREHPIRGQQILGSTELDELLPWVRGHHERWDGEGYPDRLSGTVIPLEARILCVCDAYDAMVSDRAYRSAISPHAALLELERGAGTQFDPRLARELILLVAAEQEDAAPEHEPVVKDPGSRMPDWSPLRQFAPENS